MSSASKFLIREAGKPDAELLAKIHQESFPNYWNIEAFNDFFAETATLALLAVTPEPAGMMVLRILPDEAEIMTIAVAPPFRRLGIGRALLEYAMNKVRKSGARHMFLDVEDGNSAALALYKGYGFDQINRRKHYYRQKDGSYTDALVMRCKLA